MQRIRYQAEVGMPSRTGNRAPVPKKESGLFWWTIVLTLMMSVATFSWFFCIYVFSHPEKPFSYRVLEKMNKVQEIKNFDRSSVPRGEFLKARDAYARFFAFQNESLTTQNNLLKRAYLQNYEKISPIYIEGNYKVYHARPLNDSDVISQGMVARARSEDIPNVILEFVLPASSFPKDAIVMGQNIHIKPGVTFASLLHAEKLAAEQLCLTVIPITYDPWETTQNQTVQQSPPNRLNLKGHWPLTEEQLGTEASYEQDVTHEGEVEAPVASLVP